MIPAGKSVEVSVLFVNDRAMRALNLRYRAKDKTTDVLSFPQTDKEAVVPSGHLVLGDIVISAPQAVRQAAAFSVGFYQELARLLIHGLLHLFGYDHELNPYQARKMRAMEEKLLLAVGPQRKPGVKRG